MVQYIGSALQHGLLFSHNFLVHIKSALQPKWLIDIVIQEYLQYGTSLAGIALITANEALLWTDGRYFLQATQQLSDQWKLMRIGEDPPLETWIADVCTLLNFKLLTVFL